MYIILATFIFLIIFYFANTLISMIINITNQSKSSEQIGNLWFIGLLIVNIAVIIFIYAFYYYKISIQGNKGATGLQGFPGLPGNDCKINGGCGAKYT